MKQRICRISRVILACLLALVLVGCNAEGGSETTLPTEPATETTLFTGETTLPSETNPQPTTVVTEPTTEATEPTTEATEPTTEATEPTTEATEPTTEATEPTTEATEPTTEATEPTTEATEPTTEATEPTTEATEPTTEATEPTTEATEPTTEATEPPTEATEPPTEATEPPTEATEPTTEATEPTTEATEPTTEATEPPTEASRPSGGHTGPYIVCIDAGHQKGAINSTEPVGPGSSTMKKKLSAGTQGVSTRIPEYQLTLDVSLMLKEELQRRGYKVVMIRETNDCPMSNAERAIFANESGADIFVRIHANGSENADKKGALCCAPTTSNPFLTEENIAASRLLSKLVVNHLCQETGAKNRGLYSVDNMTGINWCEIPVTIVEMGYMSNAEEDKLMATQEYREKIVEGIADGIDAYFAQS